MCVCGGWPSHKPFRFYQSLGLGLALLALVLLAPLLKQQPRVQPVRGLRVVVDVVRLALGILLGSSTAQKPQQQMAAVRQGSVRVEGCAHIPHGPVRTCASSQPYGSSLSLVSRAFFVRVMAVRGSTQVVCRVSWF